MDYRLAAVGSRACQAVVDTAQHGTEKDCLPVEVAMSRRPFARLAWLAVAVALMYVAEWLGAACFRCMDAANWAEARVPE